MENIWNIELEQDFEQKQNNLDQAMSIETDRLFSSLEKSDTSSEDINELVCRLSETNPIFNNLLTAFKDSNSANFEKIIQNDSLEQSTETNNNEIRDYFNINTSDFGDILADLDSLSLNIDVLLEWYKKYIENNLNWLPKDIIEKIKLSITIRLSKILKKVLEYKDWKIDTNEKLEEFRTNRWIINEKIIENLWFISNKLFPSLEAYLKIQSGVEIPKKYQNKLIIWHLWPEIDPNYINIEEFVEEMTELLNSEIDPENWDFNEWFFSTQNILNNNDYTDHNLLKYLWMHYIEVTLLNDEDLKIENEANMYFMAMIAVQIWVETLWWIPWTVIWWWVDLYDTFSNEETLLKISQELWLSNKEFRMDKTWIDNILAWLWLIPWTTQIIKWSKLVKFMKKIDPNAFKKAIWEVKNVMRIDWKSIWKAEKITDPELIKVIEKLKELWIPKEFYDLINNSWLSKLEWTNLINRFQNFEKKWIDYNKIINSAIEKIPGLTKKEAFLIFTYTDKFLYENLNSVMRSSENLTDWQTKLINNLNQALEKMPNMEWELVFRWDDWIGWKWKIWEIIELKAYTSIANNENDILVWKNTNMIIIVEWIKGKVKDITSLALVPNYWDKIPSVKNTSNEWLILPNSSVEITETFQWKNKYYIKVKQIK